jgi:ABC-type phosphate/phosphonate transport system substrate-binding protein
MSAFIAALPMYDWPECRDEVDALWAQLCLDFAAVGIDAPRDLVRRNADMPAVPGGIRDDAGRIIAPDPATLPPGELDLGTVWRHPALLFAQTCWGPMGLGLQSQVTVVGQPDYSGFEGGAGEAYSSAMLMRRSETASGNVPPPCDGRALIPVERLRGQRFAYNGEDSMSGLIALTRDLADLGETPDLFSQRVETGGHRASVVAVAEGRADVCTIDCRSWALARRFEPRSADVAVVGWTARRPGLPYISAFSAPRYRIVTDGDHPLGRVGGISG